MSRLPREELIRNLPYARRYARAVTGSQRSGDELVAASLRELLAGEGVSADGDVRLMLYRAVTGGFDRMTAHEPPPAGLTHKQRQMLLLTALEELTAAQAADVVDLPAGEAHVQLSEARERLRASAATDVLIIEDEPIIAMDIEELVQNCGHRVVGVAATEADAVAIATRERPGLILADINLGAGGDGTSAVARILQRHHAPVIFVTAYPERLLTGEALEPAFVITKPFEPLTLAIATYQAVTGGVRID
jgi:CheY-like chemotaxis protein